MNVKSSSMSFCPPTGDPTERVFRSLIQVNAAPNPIATPPFGASSTLRPAPQNTLGVSVDVDAPSWIIGASEPPQSQRQTKFAMTVGCTSSVSPPIFPTTV